MVSSQLANVHKLTNLTLAPLQGAGQQHVELKVFDLLGREISLLSSGYMSAGIHRLPWQPKNLAAGIYVYTLSVEDFSESRKLIYIK